MKRLGIYYATACYRDAEGRYYTSNGLGRYLQVLHERYAFEVALAAPTTSQSLAHLRYPLPTSRVTVHELPYFETFLGAVKVRAKLISRLRAFLREQRVDVLWLRYPGAYGTVLWQEAKRMGVPVFYEIVGDPVSLLSNSPHLPGLRKWLAVWLAQRHENTLRRHLRNTPAFAISTALAERLASDGISPAVIVVSTLMRDDFFWREDTCQQKPIQVLFVGVLRHEKSAETLIGAVARLQQQGLPLHLHIVGDGPQRVDVEREAVAMLLPNTCYFHGFQTSPEVLHRHYVQADLFVLSSVSEGLGRVLLEAMARGVPVVATRVGGIPEIVKHEQNGLLVPPRDVGAMAQAMERLITEASLRRRVIANGYQTAEQHTTEGFLEKVMQFIREQVGVNLLEQGAMV